MYLYLVQHGVPKSKEQDPERPLSAEGSSEVEKVAASVSKLISAGRIFHSGKLRAEQTAVILGHNIKAEVQKDEGLSPMDEPSIWADRLKKEDNDIMLVGHLPHLQRLTSLLLSGDTERKIINFIMGGVVCLERQDEGWSLQWMAVPEMYR